MLHFHTVGQLYPHFAQTVIFILQVTTQYIFTEQQRVGEVTHLRVCRASDKDSVYRPDFKHNFLFK